MLELHGWLVIRAYPGESDTELEDDQSAVNFARGLVNQHEVPTGFVDLRPINGVGQVHLATLTNHRSPDVEEILELVSQISAHATGSYGLIYIHDDEHPEGYGNEFRVLVVSRGQVVERIDPFLSPLIPVIEDSTS